MSRRMDRESRELYFVFCSSSQEPTAASITLQMKRGRQGQWRTCSGRGTSPYEAVQQALPGEIDYRHCKISIIFMAGTAEETADVLREHVHNREQVVEAIVNERFIVPKKVA